MTVFKCLLRCSRLFFAVSDMPIEGLLHSKSKDDKCRDTGGSIPNEFDHIGHVMPHYAEDYCTREYAECSSPEISPETDRSNS